MLLKLYNLEHTLIGGLKNAKDAKVESELSTGDKTLSFSWNKKNKLQPEHEFYVRTDTDEYVVKEFSKGTNGYRGITARLNLEDIEGRVWMTYLTEDSNAKQMADYALTGTGWTCISTVDNTKIRNISLTKVNSYNVFEKILEAFTCEVMWDTLNKIVYLKEKVGTDKGVYFISGLNLKELSESSDSYDYVTKIIPIGADSLDITEINDGKDYLENYQYSNKAKTLIWEDSNYTDAQALKDDAEYKLNELSKPKRTLQAKVFDLAKLKIEYSILEYSVGDTVTLISNKDGINEEQRITKTVEYLNNPEKNTCEISNTVLTFEEMQKQLLAAAACVSNITTDNGTVKGSSVDAIDVTQIIGLERYIAEDVDDMKVNNLYVTTELGAIYAVIGNVTSTAIQTTTLNVTSRADIALGYITELHTTNQYGNYAKFGVVEADNISALIEKVDNLEANEITASYLNANYADINLANIAVGTITTAMIGIGAIETAQIADGSISDAKIVDLTATKLTAGTIDASYIEVVNLNCANLTVGSINGTQIAPGAVDMTKLSGDLSGTITKTSSDVSQALADAGLAKTAAYEATNSINNMSIGGRNLISNSNDRMIDHADYPTKVSLTQSTISVLSSGAFDAYMFVNPTIPFSEINANVGTSYTFSIEIRTTNLVTGQCFITFDFRNSPSSRTAVSGNVSNTRNGVWQKIIGTIQTTSIVYTQCVIVLVMNSTTTDCTGNIFEYRNLKLEKGNKETDWTAAPEDVDATISSVQTTADGKNTVYYRNYEPPTEGTFNVDDVWFNTADGFHMRFYNGTSWSLGQFGTSAIYAGAITTDKIYASAITAGKIAVGAVTAEKIYANAVTANAISAGAVETDKLATNSVTAVKIAAGAVTASAISAGSVTANKIDIVDLLSTGLIGANAITAVNIVSEAITTTKLGVGAVTANKIATNAITADKIKAWAVTANKIDVVDLLSTGLIGANAIKAVNIASEAITTTKLGVGAVTANKIDVVDLLSTGLIAANALTASNIAAGAITADKINVTDLYALGATIGGFTIGATYLANNTSSLAGATNSVYVGTNGISCGTAFRITKDGDAFMHHPYIIDGLYMNIKSLYPGYTLTTYTQVIGQNFVHGYYYPCLNDEWHFGTLWGGKVQFDNGDGLINVLSHAGLSLAMFSSSSLDPVYTTLDIKGIRTTGSIYTGTSTNTKTYGHYGQVLHNNILYESAFKIYSDADMRLGLYNKTSSKWISYTQHNATGGIDIYGDVTIHDNLTVYDPAILKSTLHVIGRIYDCVGVYNATSSSASNLYINSSGNFYRSTSSSRRYKENIEILSLDKIRKLYDVNVYTFKYKEGYMEHTDERYQQDIPGLIAEEVNDVLPIAVDHVNGQTEMWNSQIIVPCILKLVQDVNQRVNQLEFLTDLVYELQFEVEKLKLENEQLKQAVA